MSKRLIALVTSALLIGGLFVGAPGPVLAVADSMNVYIGFSANTDGGSCADPDYRADGSADSTAINGAVNDTATGGTLHFCPGIYDVNVTIDLTGKDITLSGAGAATTILDGGATLFYDGSYDSGGVQIISSSGDITVERLTLQHGHAFSGGAVSGNLVTTRNCTFLRNTSEDQGGAISASIVDVRFSVFFKNSANAGGAITAPDGAVIIKSSFTQNRALLNAYEGTGGAINIPLGNIDIIDGVFTNNSSGGSGGAIYAATATVNTSTFNSNTAGQYGGAISTVNGTIARSRFTRNTAGTDGGAINLASSGTSSVTSSTFTSNIASQSGGAINFDPAPGSEVLVSRNLFTKNEAPYGGATDQDNGGLLIFQRNVFTANRAVAEDAEGGALWVSNATFSGNRFSRNRSDVYGGAVYATNSTVGRAALRSQFGGNRARRGPDVYYSR
jgi:hypothetical protein